MEKLTCEVALYWQVLCDHIAQLGTDGDMWLEKVLPTPTAYCAYIRQYTISIVLNLIHLQLLIWFHFCSCVFTDLIIVFFIASRINNAFKKETDVEVHLSNEFIMDRLLNIMGAFDLSDEAGR